MQQVRSLVNAVVVAVVKLRLATLRSGQDRATAFTVFSLTFEHPLRSCRSEAEDSKITLTVAPKDENFEVRQLFENRGERVVVYHRQIPELKPSQSFPCPGNVLNCMLVDLRQVIGERYAFSPQEVLRELFSGVTTNGGHTRLTAAMNP